VEECSNVNYSRKTNPIMNRTYLDDSNIGRTVVLSVTVLRNPLLEIGFKLMQIKKGIR